MVQGKRPILALEINIEEVFFHLPRLLRSDPRDPSTWNPTALPSVAQLAKAVRTDWFSPRSRCTTAKTTTASSCTELLMPERPCL